MRRVALSVLLLVLLPAAASAATTRTVTTLADSGTGSLRATLGVSANGDTVKLPAGTITLTSGSIAIPPGVTVSGVSSTATTITAGRKSRIFTVTSSSNRSTLQDLHVTGGNGGSGGTGAGAAISSSAPLTLLRVALDGNGTTGAGGAISLSGSGSALTLQSSTVSGNTSGGVGGAISTASSVTVLSSTLSGNSATFAGGAISETGSGTLTLTDTSLTGNHSDASGGAIALTGKAAFDRVLLASNTSTGRDGAMQMTAPSGSGTQASTISDTTIAGNLSQTDVGGLEVLNSTGLTALTLQNDTISGNKATGLNAGTGGFDVASGQNVKLRNTIVAGNTTPKGTFNCEMAAVGGITSLGHNVSDTGADVDFCFAVAAPGDVAHVAAQLGVLGAHGGAVQTLLPAPTSPAIDAGDQASCPALDARGLSRTATGVGPCDAGAVELAAPHVTGESVAAIGDTTATISGTLDLLGRAGSYLAQYGTDASYGTTAAAVALPAGTAVGPVSVELDGLAPGTTYHVRLVATTSEGTVGGSDVTFQTTAPAPPPPGDAGGGSTTTTTDGTVFTPVIAVVPDPVVVPVTSAPPAVHCTVPKLKGLTLARVKTRLERAHCKLGAVHRPIGLPSSTKLNVLRQAPRAGQRRAAGLRVAVLLAPPAAAHG